MSIKFKRKSAKTGAIARGVKNMVNGDRWVYSTGKVEEKDYHDLGFLSAHKIKDMVNPSFSDYHLHRKYVAKDLPEKDSTPAMLAGSYLHCLYLEPEKVDKRYAIAPKVDRRTKAGKETWSQFLEESKGKTVITDEIANNAARALDALKKSRQAKMIRNDKNTACEVTGLYCKDGVVFKGRIDMVNFKMRYGADLKFMDDVSPFGFAKACAKYRYDIQAKVYMEMFDLDEFVFVCVSKDDPFEVGLYTLNDEFFAKAAEQMPDAIQRWKDLHETKQPESFATNDNPMTVVAPPSWFNYL